MAYDYREGRVAKYFGYYCMFQCAVVGIWHAYNGNAGWAIVNAVLIGLLVASSVNLSRSERRLRESSKRLQDAIDKLGSFHLNPGSIVLAVIALAFMAVPAFADGGSVTISVGVTVVTPEEYGLTAEEMETITQVHELGWNVRQCCLQDSHRLGMRSDYCFTPEVQERLQYCAKYLREE